MKKKVFGKQLSRDTKERKALFKSLIASLVARETIQTTEAKAKAIQGQVEKLVTKAKLKGESARKFLLPYLSPQLVSKVIEDLALRFAKRPGGYTRIMRLSKRLSDNAQMVLLEWVEKPVKQELTVVTDKKTKPVVVEKLEEVKPAAIKKVKKPAVKKVTKATAKKEKVK